ncbi:MAG: Com family DNA-binding transcriptional regulator [Magnetospirillum sp.]|nr:MAG: Com family DNA-binding transcriptional regulator [Magnetospirillum sp.]
MESIRCGNCHRLLARGRFDAIEIKCPRCGTLNHVRAKSPDPERPRASNQKDVHAVSEQ